MKYANIWRWEMKKNDESTYNCGKKTKIDKDHRDNKNNKVTKDSKESKDGKDGKVTMDGRQNSRHSMPAE